MSYGAVATPVPERTSGASHAGEMAREVRVALCAPGEIWGGVEQFVDSLARFFVATDVPVVVIVLFDGPLKVRLQAAGVPVHLARAGRYDPRSVLEMVKVLRHHRVNVVHTHGYKATILGALAAGYTGARLVRTEHGRVERGHGWSYLKLWVNNAVEAAISRRAADAVVFVSRDVQSESTSSGPRALQQVVYNGLEPLPARDEQPLDGLEAEPGWFKIGIVGRLVEVKGHAHLLKAMQRLRRLSHVHLYVFGEGPLEQECRRLSEEGQLSSVVHFMGFRSNVQDYLRRLDLLVMPSLHEGLPFALLEAMYQGVPVLASRVGGLAEVIRHGVTGVLVEPGDDAGLAEAIERLDCDPALRRRLVESAHQLVCEKFLLKSMAAQYLEIYRRVLAN